MRRITIVPANIVRKYSVRFPEGTIVVQWSDPYTMGKFKALAKWTVKTELMEDAFSRYKTYIET